MEWNKTPNADQVNYDPAAIFAGGLSQHHLANTAYPIGHVTTMRPYRAAPDQVLATARKAWEEVDELGLYVHVPFCEARCGYCEYTVLEPAGNARAGVSRSENARAEVARAENAQVEDLYFDLLMREFELYRQQIGTRSKRLMGFDIGGGTPSFASTRNIERVLEAARLSFDLPETVTISIETTPKIAALEPEKVQAYYQMGIRRISMGVQTINPRLLLEVGRTGASPTYNRDAATNIRAAGFERFNVDLMYGFAHQKLASVEATVRHALALQPEYITLYRMRYKGTRIAAQAQQVSLAEVNAQQAVLKEHLLAAGYFASPGKNTFSRLPGDPGTSDYLTGRVIHGTPYIGLGLGAQSLSEKTLAYNSGAADKQLRLYQKKVLAGELPIQDLYYLSREAAIGKMISVSFYFGAIHLDSFHRKFGLAFEDAFPAEIDFVLAKGLMEYSDSPRTLRLTPQGEYQVNGVIALFYAGAVKAHLLHLPAGQAMAASETAAFSLNSPRPG